MIFHYQDGSIDEVEALRETYHSNGTLAIQLVSEENGPVSNLTVNLHDNHVCENLGPEYAFVDTNNCSNAEEFIEENSLGEFTGVYAESGYCTYPLYRFDLSKLSS